MELVDTTVRRIINLACSQEIEQGKKSIEIENIRYWLWFTGKEKTQKVDGNSS